MYPTYIIFYFIHFSIKQNLSGFTLRIKCINISTRIILLNVTRKKQIPIYSYETVIYSPISIWGSFFRYKTVKCICLQWTCAHRANKRPITVKDVFYCHLFLLLNMYINKVTVRDTERWNLWFETLKHLEINSML